MVRESKPSQLHGEPSADADRDVSALLDAARDVAGLRGQSVWAVGGVVRDLLDGRTSIDVDLVALDDATAYARALAVRVGGTPRSEPRFLTTRFTSRSGLSVDVVRARCETYALPSSLPSVRPGTLVEDLYRRDFTVNAMALPLGGDHRDLVDPFGGREDLVGRRLRVLHDRSFFDDPTRILRGIRLGARLDLGWEESTIRQAESALSSGSFDHLSRSRLLAELRLLLADPDVARRALAGVTSLRLADNLLPGVAIDSRAARRLERLAQATKDPEGHESSWLETLVVLTWDLSQEERTALAERLGVSGEARRKLAEIPTAVARLGRALETLDSSHERYRAAKNLGRLGRIVGTCCGPRPVRAFLAGEWSDLRSRELRISGRDLIELGFEEGPAIGDALEATLRARLDREIEVEEELGFATRYLREALRPSVSGDRDDRNGCSERPAGVRSGD